MVQISDTVIAQFEKAIYQAAALGLRAEMGERDAHIWVEGFAAAYAAMSYANALPHEQEEVRDTLVMLGYPTVSDGLRQLRNNRR